jgi:hypothetical protein
VLQPAELNTENEADDSMAITLLWLQSYVEQHPLLGTTSMPAKAAKLQFRSFMRATSANCNTNAITIHK